MAYSKQTWENLPNQTTPITAERLNHMEDGIYEAYEHGGGGETLPVGSEIDFDGTSTDIPTGWEETTDPESYSTDEVKTNKTWINGKPIYRKVIEITSPSLSATTDYRHGIEDIDILRPVEMFVLRNIDNTVRPINIAYSVSTIITQGTKTTISYRIPTDIWTWAYQPSDLTLYVIVEYTKTTD